MTYEERVKKTMKEFCKGSTSLKVTNVYVRNPDDGHECQLCGWPKTSKNPVQPGLTYVYELSNLSTGEKLRAGRNCIAKAQKLLREEDFILKIEMKGQRPKQEKNEEQKGKSLTPFLDHLEKLEKMANQSSRYPLYDEEYYDYEGEYEDPYSEIFSSPENYHDEYGEAVNVYIRNQNDWDDMDEWMHMLVEWD